PSWRMIVAKTAPCACPRSAGAGRPGLCGHGRPPTLCGMTGTLLGLLLIGALIWLWMGALAAREFAIRAGQQLCRANGVQLLDQSVALGRLRLQRTSTGFAVERRYHFEVSLDGMDRGHG